MIRNDIQGFSLFRENFIRPSAIAQLSICNGAATMQAAVKLASGRLDDDDDDHAAAIGRDLHHRAANALQMWQDGAEIEDAISFAKTKAKAGGVDSWSVFCLNFALVTASSIIDRYQIKRENCYIEKKLDMTSLGLLNGGTADLVFVADGNQVIIVDYKFGWIDQGEAIDHEQIACYAAAAARAYDCKKAIAYIIQPRAESDHRVPAPALFEKEDITATEIWTKSIATKARRESAELTPNYWACINCKAIGKCRAAKEWIMNAKQALDWIGWPTTPEDAAEALGAAKTAEKMAKAVITEAKEKMAQGANIPGWSLRPGRTTQTIEDQGNAIFALDDSGLDLVELAHSGAVFVKPSKLDEKGKEVVKDYIIKKTSEPILIADKRQGKE